MIPIFLAQKIYNIKFSILFCLFQKSLPKNYHKAFNGETFKTSLNLKEAEISNRGIGRQLHLNVSTIQRSLKKVRWSGKLRKFTREQEKEIVDHANELDARFYSLTLKSLSYVAFENAEKKYIQNSFSSTSKLAGRTGLRNSWKETYSHNDNQEKLS